MAQAGVYGAVIGAVFVGVVGFTWGGWVTGGTANDRAMAMSQGDVVASMVPVALRWHSPTQHGPKSLKRSGPRRPISGAMP